MEQQQISNSNLFFI